MATGTQLSVLRSMLNAECGEEMDETASPGRVAINNQLLNNKQAILGNLHLYLRGKTVVNLAAVPGTQYYNLPAGIDFDRLEKPVFVNVNNFRYRLGEGIGQEEYNLFRSDLGVTASPVMRWQMVNVTNVLQIELWPIPSVPQTIVFSGLLPLAQMVNDTDICAIDDLALVLVLAAEVLARKGATDAEGKAAEARAYCDALKAGVPFRFEKLNLSGREPSLADFYRGNNRRPVVATH